MAGRAAAGALALLLVAFVVAVAFDRPAAEPETAVASTPPAPNPGTEPPSGINDGADVAAQMGWGGAQPSQMRATVKYGTASKPLTPERRELLASQLEEVRTAALEIGTVAEAERRGYVKNFQYLEGRGFEYIKWSNFTPTLDLANPTMLAFPDDQPDSKVAAVAYNILGTREGGPPTHLPLEAVPWHFHHNLCRKDGSVIGNVETAPDGTLYADHAERCEDAGATYEPELDHWMVDLWVIPGWENPWGLVSSKHPDLFTTPQDWFPEIGPAQPDH